MWTVCGQSTHHTRGEFSSWCRRSSFQSRMSVEMCWSWGRVVYRHFLHIIRIFFFFFHIYRLRVGIRVIRPVVCGSGPRCYFADYPCFFLNCQRCIWNAFLKCSSSSLQPFPPPSPRTRRVRPMSGPSPSPLALASFGFSLSPMRETVAKGSKSRMSRTMVSYHEQWSVTANCKIQAVIRKLLVAPYYTMYSSSFICRFPEDYQQLIEDIVRDGRLYASENHQEILKVQIPVQHYQPKCHMGLVWYFKKITRLLHVWLLQSGDALWSLCLPNRTRSW